MSDEIRYQPAEVEPRWQRHWEEAHLFRAGERQGAPRSYVLEMFPYPSGAMHMGHARVYTLGDVLARLARHRGFDVLHPMGYDAFGLPAENAALKDGLHPAVRTPQNIAGFSEDLKSIGLSIDWSREISTHTPEYYRWNQWFFLRMLERGIVYRRTNRVNWCPSCNTVLANEQVIDGLCWRCDSMVEDRRIPEWAFRITSYADELLSELDKLTEWPERVTTMQRNWIGRSEGAQVEFTVEGTDVKIPVFTTRLDTIFGCTYVVVAPDHRLVPRFVSADKQQELARFAEQVAAARKADRAADQQKLGLFTGAYAINPFNGQRVPVWAANFVVADYGTGAVMSVPAHDQRDFEFARQFGLPIKPVIAPADGTPLLDPDSAPAAFTDDGVLVDSGDFSGLASADARRQMADFAQQRGFGRPSITYRLRDWGFSRQRYWGTPIPIVYCDACDPEHAGIPVPDDQLPVRLPSQDEMDLKEVLSGKGEPPLAKIPSFVNTTCPRCSGPARREVETMDTFVDSCWYYARFVSPHEDRAPVSRVEADKWLPVSTYIGGPEHAVMHLLYFRFWTKVMHELGLVPMREPVRRLVTQGIVNGADGRKMSKRFGNGVSPKDIVRKYGADVTRLFLLFASPPQEDMRWSDEQVEGISRFVNRVWRLLLSSLPELGKVSLDAASQAQSGSAAHELRKKTHKTIRKFTQDIDRLQFNVCVAALMELSNQMHDTKLDGTEATAGALREAFETFARLASPLAPHIAAEMWSRLGRTEELQLHPWPEADEALLVDDLVTYAVQVNGKLRGEVKVPAAASDDEIKAAAQVADRVQAHLEGRTIRKVVLVRGRLVNFVVG